VVAHLARNADALINLLDWARTGVETPMYPSREARDAGIEATAALPPAELRADYAAASARFAEAVEAMPESAWTASLRNMQGRQLPAADVPWMRAKEVWVHGTDLAAGLTFADVPAECCAALVDDGHGLFTARDETPDVTLVATDVERTWGSGAGKAEGPVSAIAGWLTRGDDSGLTGDVPVARRGSQVGRSRALRVVQVPRVGARCLRAQAARHPDRERRGPGTATLTRLLAPAGQPVGMRSRSSRDPSAAGA
jgi:maleylpyruvate isomerase